jgi:hypothetical protein
MLERDGEDQEIAGWLASVDTLLQGLRRLEMFVNTLRQLARGLTPYILSAPKENPPRSGHAGSLYWIALHVFRVECDDFYIPTVGTMLHGAEEVAVRGYCTTCRANLQGYLTVL